MDMVPLVPEIRPPDALRDDAFETPLGSGSAKLMVAIPPLVAAVLFSSIEDYPVGLVQFVEGL